MLSDTSNLSGWNIQLFQMLHRLFIVADIFCHLECVERRHLQLTALVLEKGRS